MFYKSTRNSEVKVSSAQAIAQGISEDGGLFVPSEIPAITLDISRLLAKKATLREHFSFSQSTSQISQRLRYATV